MEEEKANKPLRKSKSAVGPRERIMETATRLFYSQGYNSTGINQILDEAKVAKASLYQHFGSKDELGIAYLQSAREEWFQGLDKWTSDKNTPTKKLLACFDFLEYALLKHELRGCKFINMLSEIADSSPLMRKEILEHKTKLREYLKTFVRESLSLQNSQRVENIGDSIYLLFEGAIVETKIYKETWPVKSARKMAASLLEDKA